MTPNVDKKKTYNLTKLSSLQLFPWLLKAHSSPNPAVVLKKLDWDNTEYYHHWNQILQSQATQAWKTLIQKGTTFIKTVLYLKDNDLNLKFAN